MKRPFTSEAYLAERTHSCAVDRCLAQIPEAHVMCRRHWAMVPEFTRKQVLAGLKRGMFSRLYRTAMYNARDAVQREEARQK